MRTVGSRYALQAILILAAVFFAASPEAKIVDAHIYIIPAGGVDGKIPKSIKEALPGVLPMSVSIEIMPPEAMPEGAYDPSRKQYDAGAVLNSFAKRNPLDIRVDVILIVTDADLFMPGREFVFGIAQPSKAVCIMSLARLKNEFYGLKGDEKLLLKRAAKEAVHKLGHAWGLERCPDGKCVLSASDSIKDIDRKKLLLCHPCRARLHNHFSGAPIVRASSFNM